VEFIGLNLHTCFINLVQQYKKILAEADGSRDNLPPLADAPEQFGLGIKREQPKHY
jgi:hypothetical protein